MTHYILGGGVAGLIYAHYNEKFSVISDSFGGQFNSEFSLGPRYLHETENTVKLLKEMGLECKKQHVRVGFVDDKGFTPNPNEKFREAYFCKSRSTTNLSSFDSTTMNGYAREFDALDIDFKKLIDKLATSISIYRSIDDLDLYRSIYIDRSHRLIKSRISSIDLIDQIVKLENGEKLEYESLISTISLKIFSSIATPKINVAAESIDVTYALVDRSNEFDLQGYDFVYDCRSSTKYHRMSKDKNGVVLDFVNMPDEFRRIAKSTFVLKDAQITSRCELPKIKNVVFAGRYGTWNRKWKTEVVVDEAIKFRDERRHLEKST